MTIAEINYGEVFTRRWVVETLLDLTGYSIDVDLGTLVVIEPSCGSGAFLGPLVERLLASASARGRDYASLSDAVRAYDLQVAHVEASRSLAAGLLIADGADAATAASLAAKWVNQADFLLDDVDRPADLVIGNPPYIRYDDLPAGVATAYRQAWPTMRGRGDIYVGFIERSMATLKPGGRLGFICADRWMRNQYGTDLRRLVGSRYAVEHVWSMHDVDAFDAHVSAYPAITVIAHHDQASVVVAETTSQFGAEQALSLTKWSQDETLTDFMDHGVKAHRLPHWFDGAEMWPAGSPARLALIERLDEFHPLHDLTTGTKVSIGVATGADQVYITKDPTIVEADRLLPMAMRRDLMSGNFDWQGNYLVNPWTPDGVLVSLSDYPRLAKYLRSHPVLRDRFVAKKNPSSWHRTIDKVTPGLVDRPKLLLQDMKATIHPVLERGGHYPHHNLYFITSDVWDLEVLGGLLLSRIAQAFIEAYCVRMRGGTLRFQSQYLKRIRVPAPDTMAVDVAADLRRAFLARDVDGATLAASRAYGIELAEYELELDN